MFDSIGWAEIFFIIVIGIIVIGPEKLPGVIQDVRAAIFAARRAINNAKEELNGDFGDDFEEFRKPINTVSEYAAMGPKRAIAKVLFDEEEEYLDQFDPKNMMEEKPAPAAGQNQLRNQAKQGGSAPQAAQPATPPAPQPEARKDKGDYSSGGGFSWADIT
ncbi:Sec-independent protein translocase protein TatB [Corynebacterium lubricantis]|uniref:Sec-independent protein translocase protein TatB n=1 Tax=Corynebacterium lubricantis TaxID=541095 RepID=UPI00036B93A8|nr:Sec-independent protein translocase protein TatB [Corynebacterium lubricantis]